LWIWSEVETLSFLLQIISFFQKINHNFSDFSFQKRNATKFSEKAKKKFAEKQRKIAEKIKKIRFCWKN